MLQNGSACFVFYNIDGGYAASCTFVELLYCFIAWNTLFQREGTAGCYGCSRTRSGPKVNSVKQIHCSDSLRFVYFKVVAPVSEFRTK